MARTTSVRRQLSANINASIPTSVRSCERTVMIDSAKTSFNAFVSLAIFVSSSPERARLWDDSDRRCRWLNSSRLSV